MNDNNVTVPLTSEHLDRLVGSTIKRLEVKRSGLLVTFTMATTHGHFVLSTTVIDPVNGFVKDRRPVATTRHPFTVNTDCAIATGNSN